MTSQEAITAMRNGKKVIHQYFDECEYYYMKDGKIFAEDGVDHTDVISSTGGSDWRKDGWDVLPDNTNIEDHYAANVIGGIPID